MVQQLKMLNWFLITLSFMLKTAVKCLFSIAIAVVLYVEKNRLAIFLSYSRK